MCYTVYYTCVFVSYFPFSARGKQGPQKTKWWQLPPPQPQSQVPVPQSRVPVPVLDRTKRPCPQKRNRNFTSRHHLLRRNHAAVSRQGTSRDVLKQSQTERLPRDQFQPEPVSRGCQVATLTRCWKWLQVAKCTSHFSAQMPANVQKNRLQTGSPFSHTTDTTVSFHYIPCHHTLSSSAI